MFLNLWLVFLISGFWHGAAWTFIIWGLWHGLFLILDRIFLKKNLALIGKIPSILLTYFIVLIGWVFFRSNSIDYAIDYITQMFSFDFSMPSLYIDSKFWFVLGFALFTVFLSMFSWVEKNAIQWYMGTSNLALLGIKSIVTIILAWMCIASIFASDFNPFIYFKF